MEATALTQLGRTRLHFREHFFNAESMIHLKKHTQIRTTTTADQLQQKQQSVANKLQTVGVAGS